MEFQTPLSEEKLAGLINDFKAKYNVNWTDIKCSFDDLKWHILEDKNPEKEQVDYIISIRWNYKRFAYKEMGTNSTNVELYMSRFKKFLKEHMENYSIIYYYDEDQEKLQNIVFIIEKN